MTLVSDYAAWAAWLEGFGRGEAETCAALPPMHGDELGAPAAQRFAQRCGEALDARLLVWAKGLDRDMGRAQDAQQLRLCLIHARRRLLPIRALTESPLLLEELRTGLGQALYEAVQRVQEDLVRQAARAHPGAREEMIRVVRDVPLRAALDQELVPSAATAPVADDRTRPRVILLTTEAGRG
jgi:hypothetical protein